MHKIQQTLKYIPRSVEGTSGYQHFVREYLKPLTVESTLTLEEMTQEQQAYLFVYFYKKIVELGLTLNQFQEINSLDCSEYIGGKKRSKNFVFQNRKKCVGYFCRVDDDNEFVHTNDIVRNRNTILKYIFVIIIMNI